LFTFYLLSYWKFGPHFGGKRWYLVRVFLRFVCFSMVYSEFHLYRRPTTLGVTLLVVHVLKTDLLLKVQNHVHQLSRNAVLLISEERVDFDSSSIFVDHDSLEMFIFKRALVFMLLFPCRSTYLGFDRACQRLYCFTCGIPYQYVPSSLVDQLINEITPPTVLPGGVIF
jgi:hypothetical protein